MKIRSPVSIVSEYLRCWECQHFRVDVLHHVHDNN